MQFPPKQRVSSAVGAMRGTHYLAPHTTKQIWARRKGKGGGKKITIIPPPKTPLMCHALEPSICLPFPSGELPATSQEMTPPPMPSWYRGLQGKKKTAVQPAATAIQLMRTNATFTV